MHKNIGRRFIAFNMLIISIIAAIMAGFVLFGSQSSLSAPRLIISVILMLGMVFIGSVLLSRIAIAPIKAAWQKQLDFTADASHELRTPLAVMRTNLELVMDSPDETVESQMQWLENIEAENHRMTKLVEDLLTLSRADAHQQALDRKVFMLDELLEEEISALCPLASTKNITCEYKKGCTVAINGDRERIKQLIIILLDNAIQYTPAGGSVTAALSREKDGYIRMEIEDTGFGIAEQDIGKVFDRFYRGTSTRKMHQDGSGLGLSIAKWIVDEHGGTITVESKVEKGTRFIVTLPSE